MLGVKLDVRPFLDRVSQELSRIDVDEVRGLADAIFDCYEKGKFVFVIGNGGSGSNASHFCEDAGKCTIRRIRGIPIRRQTIRNCKFQPTRLNRATRRTAMAEPMTSFSSTTRIRSPRAKAICASIFHPERLL